MNTIGPDAMSFRSVDTSAQHQLVTPTPTLPQDLNRTPGLLPPSPLQQPAGAPSPTAAGNPIPPLIPSGLLPSSVGYAQVPARGIPLQLQTLGAGTHLVTAACRVPFPAAVSAITLYAPPAAAGGASDGKIGIGVSEDPNITIGNVANLVNFTNTFGGSGFVYCPTPVSWFNLWLPLPAGHEYLYAEVISQGGATNVFAVVLMTICPLGDYIGT